MSGARLTVDGLWRCLCPSIDAVALATAISVPYRPRRATRLSATTACAGLRAAPRRRLHTTSRKLQDDSAETKQSPAGLGNAETKTNKNAAAEPIDSGDRESAVKIDQEATRAWKAYFDLVLVEGTEKRQDNHLAPVKQLVEDPSSEVVDAGAQKKDTFDAGKDGQQGFSPSWDHNREQSSSTFANANPEKDPFAVLFGGEQGKKDGIPNISDFSVGPSPELAGEHTGQDTFDVLLDGSTCKSPFDALFDTEREQQRKSAVSHDSLGGASSVAAGKGTERVSLDEFPPPETGQQARIPVPNDSGTDSSPIDMNPGSAISGSANGETTEATRVVDEVPSAQKRGKPRSTARTNSEMVDRLLQMKPPYTDVPPEAGREDILGALTVVRMRGPRKYRRIMATLMKRLLAMDPRPKAIYYDMLFRAHCVPEGSADVIAKLLKEMRDNKVHWSTNAYHSVLRALAIHPDYLIRNVVVTEMKERWIDVLPKGHRYIAIGLLRDEQYELALEKLEYMIQQGMEVPSWVFDIFIYVFGKLGFIDDVMRLVRHRLDRGFEVSVNVWYFLLDVSSRDQNHEATVYIWNRTVQQGIVNPSDGTAQNILNMASAYGDTELATQVIQYLAERGTRLSRPHYEALADAYSVQGNVERAIEVYCIMYGAGAEVNQASAGTLCQSLNREPSRIDKAVEAMEKLKDTYKLPAGVFNVVLNEMVKSTAGTPEEAFLRGLGLYRRIREFLPTGPNWETFRNLLWRCTRPDIAQFLAGEMVAFNIRQNLVIIELMFKVNVEHNGPTHRVKAAFYKVAPHFHSDYALGSRRWQHIMDLSVKLVKRLIAERDPEAWWILDICKRNGLEEDKVVALREEVEAGRLATVHAPTLPDVVEKEWPA